MISGHSPDDVEEIACKYIVRELNTEFAKYGVQAESEKDI